MLVVAASALWGLGKVRSLRRRRDDLLGVVTALQFVCAELRSASAPLEEIFASVPDCRLFQNAARILDEDGYESTRLLWHKCVYAEDGLFLSDDQRTELDRIGAVLGRFPAPEQLPAIERCIERMESHAAAAGLRAEKGARLYMAMALSVGLMAAAVLV